MRLLGLTLLPFTLVVIVTGCENGIKLTGTSSASGIVATTPGIPAPLTIANSPLPVATIDAPYTVSFGVTGGEGAISCSVSQGSLPAGLTLNGKTCSVQGTATSTGVTTFQLTATDQSIPTPDKMTGQESIVVQGTPLVEVGPTLLNPILGQTYLQSLAVSGGVAPYHFQLVSTVMPAGLTLSSDGTMSGTASNAGATSLTVEVNDSSPITQTLNMDLLVFTSYPQSPEDGLLEGNYAFSVHDTASGSDPSVQNTTVGSFYASGNGLLNGEQDGSDSSSADGPASIIGTYTVGLDQQGLLTLTTLMPDGKTSITTTYSIAASTAGDAPAGSGSTPSSQDPSEATGSYQSFKNKTTSLKD